MTTSYDNVRWHVPGGDVRKLSQAVFGAEHTLIAGTTGSGKSVLLNGIMRDFLRSYAPCECELLLIDPKLVELDYLKRLPHCKGYADSSSSAASLLRTAVAEMQRRNQVTKQQHLRSYPGRELFIVIDELHPLLISESAVDIKHSLTLLLTQARSARIHVIACTQVPNRKTIPADIVSLFTMRIGLRCVDAIESRQIIGAKGCEMLPRYGKAIVRWNCDMLSATIPMTDYSEVEDLVRYWTSYRCVA